MLLIIVCVARRNGTRVPKQNHDRRAAFHVWHPGAVQKGFSCGKPASRLGPPVWSVTLEKEVLELLIADYVMCMQRCL